MSKAGEVTPLPLAPRRGGRGTTIPQRSPRTLSRDAIVDAALRVLDSEGLAALTMRRVADELGTGPSSLYAHVADKDAMVEAVLDRVIGEVEVPEVIDPQRWEEQLKDIARSARATMGRHRDIARASLGTIPTGENSLPVGNAMVGILLASGVSRRVAALSVDILALYFTAMALEESLEDYDLNDEAAATAFNVELQQFFAGLPADRFPYLVDMAGPLTTGDRDERFEFGLDMLVRGIASTAVSPTSKERP
jgi:AcrR family transcriptional regulator